MSTQETWTDPEGHDHYDDDCSMGGCEHIEDAPACVKGLRHRWTAEGHGGCEENPGVWSLGGTSHSFESHCVYCGAIASVVAYGWQRDPGQCDTVRYTRGAGDAVAVAAALRAERRRALARRRYRAHSIHGRVALLEAAARAAEERIRWSPGGEEVATRARADATEARRVSDERRAEVTAARRSRMLALRARPVR